ncbi:50S ribosomal protein L4, chloroplastic [Senna tora]|uniref:50S ribosomal protein L4, chloroplastic n=1 Tax=Senna tora TaxID=362788 RepID=A0A834XH80_9FABA|nr:50S ribosomal protein L4, chloroplastic [Senna tora]
MITSTRQRQVTMNYCNDQHEIYGSSMERTIIGFDASLLTELKEIIFWRQKLQSPNIPTGETHIIRNLSHQEHGLLLRVKPPPLHRFNELLRLRLLKLILKLLHHNRIHRRARHRRRNRQSLLLPIDLDAPIPRFRPEHDASPGPERRPGRPLTGTAGLLLRVGFPPSATDLGACERGRGSSALVLEVGDDGAVHDGACGFWWSCLEVEVSLADLLAVEGENREGGELGSGG